MLTPVSSCHEKRRPITCGWRVRTKTDTRHNGIPHVTNCSHSCFNTSAGCAAERAPSTSHRATAPVSQGESAAILDPFLVEALVLSWALSGYDPLLGERTRVQHYSGAAKHHNRFPLS